MLLLDQWRMILMVVCAFCCVCSSGSILLSHKAGSDGRPSTCCYCRYFNVAHITVMWRNVAGGRLRVFVFHRCAICRRQFSDRPVFTQKVVHTRTHTHTQCASVTTLCSSALAKWQWYSAAGKVTVGRMSRWSSCIAGWLVYSIH